MKKGDIVVLYRVNVKNLSEEEARQKMNSVIEKIKEDREGFHEIFIPDNNDDSDNPAMICKIENNMQEFLLTYIENLEKRITILENTISEMKK